VSNGGRFAQPGQPGPVQGQHNEKWEVEYWTKKWGVTRAQLVAAVKEVGVSVAALAKKLGKKT